MKKVLIIAVLLLSVCSVYAQESRSFTADISPDQLRINNADTAEFNLVLVNKGNNGQIFEVFSPEIAWDIKTDRSLLVPPKKNFEARILIRALDINPGVYNVPLTIRKVGTAETFKKTVVIEITNPNAQTGGYLPAFRGNASMPRFVNPGDSIAISLNLDNLNRRNLTDVTIKLRSNIINKDYTTTLEPREKKLLTFTTNVDQSVLPQKDLMRIYVLKSEEGKFYQYEVNPLAYEVLPKENILTDEKEWSDFLLRTEVAKLSNHGNIPMDVPYVKKVSFFRRLFSDVYPAASVVDGAYKWTVHLDTGEERTVSVVTNYRSAGVVLFVLIIAVLAYYLLRSPLSIKKTAAIVSSRDGAISEMTIHINVRNRSRKIIRSITLIDLVPKIAEVEKKFDPTITAPSQIIKNDKKGTLLKWSIPHLDSKEENILSYRIHSKFNIIGGATLPVIVAKFITSDGKEHTTFSNRYKVNLVR